MLHSGRVDFGEMETVVFGRPAAEVVAEEARRREAERVFVMASGTLNRTTEEVAKVRRGLGNRFASLFDRMPPHTPRRAVIEAAATAREARADLIVTIGGGSVTDGAKAVQLCLANDIRSAEALDQYRPEKGPDEALHGLALLCRGLPRVKADSSDLAARLDCQIGSWLSMGPLASGVPMGASHGIGYVLGAAFDIPHGHTSCIMLPAVMHWNKLVNAERQALVAAAMGHPGEDAGEVLATFIAGLGMPRSLGAVKIGPENFARLAEQAMDTPWVPRNPRPIAGPAQIREILELAA